MIEAKERDGAGDAHNSKRYSLCQPPHLLFLIIAQHHKPPQVIRAVWMT